MIFLTNLAVGRRRRSLALVNRATGATTSASSQPTRPSRCGSRWWRAGPSPSTYCALAAGKCRERCRFTLTAVNRHFNHLWPWPVTGRLFGASAVLETRNLLAMHLFGRTATDAAWWLQLHRLTSAPSCLGQPYSCVPANVQGSTGDEQACVQSGNSRDAFSAAMLAEHASSVAEVASRGSRVFPCPKCAGMARGEHLAMLWRASARKLEHDNAADPLGYPLTVPRLRCYHTRPSSPGVVGGAAAALLADWSRRGMAVAEQGEALEEGRALFSWPDPRGESAPAADWLYCSVDCMPSRRYCQRPFGVESNFSLDTAVEGTAVSVRR
mmetsp:Transcript_26429/g.79133  ORF Transcript_26429/g.79133 Transcript_26429/m.79133 type:complete len:326 (-) Transcript_26429:41-1018(-)